MITPIDQGKTLGDLYDPSIPLPIWAYTKMKKNEAD